MRTDVLAAVALAALTAEEPGQHVRPLWWRFVLRESAQDRSRFRSHDDSALSGGPSHRTALEECSRPHLRRFAWLSRNAPSCLSCLAGLQ